MHIINQFKTAIKNPDLLVKYLQTMDIEKVRQHYRETRYQSHTENSWKPLSPEQQNHMRNILNSTISMAEELIPDEVSEIPQAVEKFGFKNYLQYHGVCYMICRKIKPNYVVETGVANGFSTLSILSALEKNKAGLLWSIDYSPYPNFNSGWLCKHKDWKNWKLTIAKTSDKLPDILQSLKKIDCFFHDSDHSYKNQMYEYKLAWNYLREEGILFSDDINRAFDDFIKQLTPKPKFFAKIRTSTSNGFIIK